MGNDTQHTDVSLQEQEDSEIQNRGAFWATKIQNPKSKIRCITCSDEALPARVLSVDANGALAMVDIGGDREEVDVSLVDVIAPGDTVLVHGGVALAVLSAKDEHGSAQP